MTGRCSQEIHEDTVVASVQEETDDQQREIGAVLHLSLNTVKTHSRVLYRKLGASSRADAVQRARRIGLL